MFGDGFEQSTILRTGPDGVDYFKHHYIQYQNSEGLRFAATNLQPRIQRLKDGLSAIGELVQELAPALEDSRICQDGFPKTFSSTS
jgi:hypothetical protein